MRTGEPLRMISPWVWTWGERCHVIVFSQWNKEKGKIGEFELKQLMPICFDEEFKVVHSLN